MFEFLLHNKSLDEIINKLKLNCSNNYKDNAQANFKEFLTEYDRLCSSNKLSAKQRAYYETIKAEYEEKLKGFSHKEQKPYWPKEGSTNA